MQRERNLRRNVVLAFVIFALLYLGHLGKPPLDAEPENSFMPNKTSPAYERRCNHFPDIENVQIVIKTSTHHLQSRVITQLRTSLQCFHDVLIFSDLDEKIGTYSVYDALNHVNRTIKDEHEDFRFYRALQMRRLAGKVFTEMEFSEEEIEAAEKLDRYKFLHMLELTWKINAAKKWYVFIEDDTYLVYSNLMQWLEIFNPTRSVYLGAPAYFEGKPFAYGGAGFILSGPAMERFVDGRENIAMLYDYKVQQDGMGDLMLTQALAEKYVTLQPAWPMLQAENPSSIPFGPGPENGAVHWCQPIITMHQVSPEEFDRLWEFQLRREDITKPLIMMELYENLIEPQLGDEKEDWFNLSDDQFLVAPGEETDRGKRLEDQSEADRMAYRSFDDCRIACQEDIRCFQFVYSTDGTCGFSFSYRLGGPRGEEGGRRWKSGWEFETIHAYQEWNQCWDAEWI